MDLIEAENIKKRWHTTVAGLVVGIPAYFGYNYLVARIEKLVFQMEANSIAFMDILNQPVKQ